MEISFLMKLRRGVRDITETDKTQKSREILFLRVKIHAKVIILPEGNFKTNLYKISCKLFFWTCRRTSNPESHLFM